MVGVIAGAGGDARAAGHYQPAAEQMTAKAGGYLTGPSQRGRRRIAQDWLARRGVDGLTLVRDYTSADGVRHLQWAQRVHGITVVDADVRANVARDGRLISASGVPAGRLNARRPAVRAGRAIRRVARSVGARSGDRDRARLVAYSAGGRERLAWRVLAAGRDALVDARTGRMVRRTNLARASDALVHDAPTDAPAIHDITQWLDNVTVLKGPNAHAFIDADDVTGTQVTPYAITDRFDVPPAGEVGPSSGDDWLYPVTPFGGCCTWDPSTPGSWHANANQAATQLFYFVNRFHDHLAEATIGFGPAAGNFEGPDAVLAQADDGANTGPKLDSASFETRPDGTPGLLAVSLWSNGRNAADDPDIVYHELTHGMSERLITDAQGYGAVSGNQSSAMAEGWSDWYALDFLAREGWLTDGSGADVRFGAYLDGQLRSEPIDCPLTPDPGCPGGGYTYADLVNRPGPYAGGEIWGQTLWQLRQELVAQHGEQDGSRRAESYISGGMRLGPAQPSFLDQRDAILAAGAVAGGADQDLLWHVFAARGMGYFAATGGDADVAPTADFSLPPAAGAPQGVVSGTVRDDAGAPVGGVTVRLAGPALRAVTSTDGTYRITGVPFATYPRLTAGGPAGYASATASDVTVGGDVTRDLTLRRNYADTRSGASVTTAARDDTAFGCGPPKLADGDQSTALQTAAPGPGDPRTFTVALSAPVADPEVLIDPAPGCSNPAAAALHGYALQASSDGVTFTTVATGSFGATELGQLNRVALRDVPAPVTAVRLVALDTLAASGYLSLSELQVLARAPAPVPTPTPTYVVPTPTPTPTPTPRRTPRLTVTVTPKRDRRAPYRFRARGTLVRPTGVSRADGCKGRIRITVRRNLRVVGGRLIVVSRRCTYTRRLTLRRRKALRGHGTLTFTLRFQGNLVLKPRSAARRVRFGPVRLPKAPVSPPGVVPAPLRA
ncbi:MAG: extracellular elastinolytic metalloproteinase [Solirubrobacteraceae bacterium]|nr:extracellular elastinolytic metalloproteinase [Solirubrobacteraceae bacterium]